MNWEIIDPKSEAEFLEIATDFGDPFELSREAISNSPAMMEIMETMVENNNRLAMYESEVETIHRLGMSFQE